MKLSDPRDLQLELQALRRYAASPRPSRKLIAEVLQALAASVEGEGRSKTARGGFNPLLVDQIRDMTNRNHHTRAMALGAKMLGYTHLAKRIQLLSQLVDLEGYLPPTLKNYSNGLYDVLMGQAERTLSKEEYAEFYAAF